MILKKTTLISEIMFADLAQTRIWFIYYKINSGDFPYAKRSKQRPRGVIIVRQESKQKF